MKILRKFQNKDSKSFQNNHIFYKKNVATPNFTYDVFPCHDRLPSGFRGALNSRNWTSHRCSRFLARGIWILSTWGFRISSCLRVYQSVMDRKLFTSWHIARKNNRKLKCVEYGDPERRKLRIVWSIDAHSSKYYFKSKSDVAIFHLLSISAKNQGFPSFCNETPSCKQQTSIVGSSTSWALISRPIVKDQKLVLD